ncbi:MAG TPA: hypothetical protein PKX92_10010 [Edaphocola sp.]|nr:hypothetical protein [Edaphocola sp.]
MSFKQTRFTIMALPQNVDSNGVLSLNIVFIPRNINPLKEVNTKFTASQKATAFVNIQPNFDIKIVNNPNEFPGKIPGNETSVVPISPFTYSAIQEKIYTVLRDAEDGNGNKKYFDIDEARSGDNPTQDAKHRAPKALDADITLRKYLPKTYRQSFNFTAPRVKNAVTDDSYRCAMRDQKPPLVMPIDKQVSWGKVYAHLLRQPLMAKNAGLIYETKIQLAEGDFENGGWIYVDLNIASEYGIIQQASLGDVEGPFIKRYAARIPFLKKNEARSLFAAVLFPVMKPGDSPIGVYDELFYEASQYNEGFATIVHANQPISGNLLQEEQDGFHPQKEIGLRLGWEDEQILVWYLRQLSLDQNTNERLDAPLGITGYHIDVKKSTDPDWESLNSVESNGELLLEQIGLGTFKGELPYQVYPTKIYDGNDEAKNYWLPMYFANWNNASLVLPDKTAALIYQNANDKTKPVEVTDTYSPLLTKTKLEYGNEYHFRVRFSDISGGGPAPDAPSPSEFAISHIAKEPFKRFLAPNAVNIINNDDIRSNTDDENFEGSSLIISRPVLGYPSVVYTGKYLDPVGKLVHSVNDILTEQQNSGNTSGGRAFGIPDPDVVSVEIKVEVETLGMDNLASDNGKEHYITLYKTYRNFIAFDENNPEGQIDIPITYKDVNVLNLLDQSTPFPEIADNDFIALTEGAIILPTARNLRITLRAIGEKKSNYWGVENIADPDFDSRFGKKTVLQLRRDSLAKSEIFANVQDAKTIQGIYLQPDPIIIKKDPLFFATLQGNNIELQIPDIVQRLGSLLDIKVKDLTLLAKNGERLQFWCSNMIRHSMSPDNSSLTFANKNELQNHWLVCTILYIDRDWTWDGLEDSSFHIFRKRKMTHDQGDFQETFIGDLELKRNTSFQAIQKGRDGKVHREYTKIILIDVVDNKPAEGKFPDTVTLEYRVEPMFKNFPAPALAESYQTEHPLVLPTTINPSQSPKLVAAGIALSPYVRNEKYSATEVRKRYLWLEFDKAPLDPNDALFCRVLAYSPDQLISNNHPSLMTQIEEPPLPLDPEYTRVVIPDSGFDNNGLNAMQQMEKSTDKERHYYLLPLPPGLHHESPELFGMFTYEFRFGHTDKIWSTSQGRFGRALRVSGLQHPAPALTCLLNRNEIEISVNAPYAIAVMDGKNVTANPPRTSIWALLYAQVKQADGLDFRNILLDEIQLEPLPEVDIKSRFEITKRKLEADNLKLKEQGRPTIEITNNLIRENTHLQIAWEKESTKQAFGKWRNTDVNKMLDLYGLSRASSLSVICVEVFGQITNAYEHIDDFENNKRKLVQKTALEFNSSIALELKRTLHKQEGEAPPKRPLDPLNSQLGMYRILRTSPLVEVPFICKP